MLESVNTKKSRWEILINSSYLGAKSSITWWEIFHNLVDVRIHFWDLTKRFNPRQPVTPKLSRYVWTPETLWGNHDVLGKMFLYGYDLMGCITMRFHHLVGICFFPTTQ